ncbi:hypothetical protein ACFQZC_17450 [Streptacidiphilus monticola]
MMLFCLPYPLAFELVVVRSRTRWAAAATVAVVLALAVGPIRSAQERLAVQQWYAAHPGLDRRLLQGVDWPGGEPDALEFGPFGARVTVFFQDSNIDGVSDAVVTVAPPDADPCGSIGITDGEGTRQSAPERCDRVAPGVWAVAAGDFTGRVERRGGVLLTLSVDSNRGSQDDLAAVARSLHPLNDHQLWPYLRTFSLLDWLVL